MPPRGTRAYGYLALGLAAAAFAWRTPVFAQSFAPARLLELEGREDLRCPRQERLSSVLICQAVIDKSGAVRASDRATHCFGNLGEDERRAELLERNVAQSRFEPARVDGEPVDVYMSLRVFFDDTSGRCEVGVFPNLGIEQDKLGTDYVAPQEIFTDGGWARPLRGDLRYEGSWQRPRRGAAFAMSVVVDERGNASDGRVETNNFATAESVQRAVESLGKQRFIPAFVDGVPRPARYFEFMYIPSVPAAR